MLIAGGILTGAAGLGLYKMFPKFFWQELAEDMQRGVAPAVKVPDPAHWPDTGLHAAWLGHSTVLMKVDGFTILTDPVLHDRVGIDAWILTLGIKRLVAPALKAGKLPKVDLILSSHAHMDHLDLSTMRELEHKYTEVVMAKSTSDLIRPNRYKRVTELGWGEEVRVGPATLRALQV